MNGQEKRIKFTMERENGVLAFLDLKMERVGEKVVTSMYPKETHTFGTCIGGQIIPRRPSWG